MNNQHTKLATTKQFWAALRAVGCTGGKGYTDPDPRNRTSKIRYPAKWLCRNRTPQAIEQIEFILWSQGVTARTRFGADSIRGTCILEK